MDEGYPKVCVILGAGASYDVHNQGSLLINPDFRPLLARELFDIANKSGYWSILQHYPGAKVLAQLLAPRISSGEIGIENALREYANHKDHRIREHFKHIPAYLRDLLQRSSTNYTSMPSCYIQLVVELLAERPHEVLFLVLNYDTLLESAISQFDSRLQFSSIGHYVAEERQAKVVKLHGSINWFMALPGKPTLDWDSLLGELDISYKPPENEIIVKDRIINATREQLDGIMVYPILTAPLAGKQLDEAVCPASHTEFAQEFLRNCHKFLIVGTSGLDEDLLNLLDSTLDPKATYFTHIVDFGNGATKSIQRFENGVTAFRNQSHKIQVKTFNSGFREYVSGNDLRTFSEFNFLD